MFLNKFFHLISEFLLALFTFQVMPVNPVIAPLSLGNGVQVSSANFPNNVATNKPTLTKISAVDVSDEEGNINFFSINIFNAFMFVLYFF